MSTPLHKVIVEHEKVLTKYHKALLARADARRDYIVAQEHCKAVAKECRLMARKYQAELNKVTKAMTHRRS
jgi:hypothetical protein